MWCIKEIDKSTLDKDPSVPLMHHDPSDLGSLILIWIIPKRLTLFKPVFWVQGKGLILPF